MRKFPTKEKTTTPEGYREYMKLLMREYRSVHKDVLQRLQNRVGFLEMELERLTKPMETKGNGTC